MKTIAGLCNHVLDLEGKEILSDSIPVTYRKMLLNLLGSSRAESGEESIEAVGCGIKISGSLDEADIEESEFKLLEKYVNKNQIGMAAVLQGRLMMFLRDTKEKADARAKELKGA